MNTKLIMTLSAVFLGAIGISLTFLPTEISNLLGINSTGTIQLAFQILGALYFSFAILNWMAKGTIVGGIYNRPVSMANFTHFAIGALALIKGLMNLHGLPKMILILAFLYSVFALLFGILLFRQPGNNEASQ
jgi:hypothetical protein